MLPRAAFSGLSSGGWNSGHTRLQTQRYLRLVFGVQNQSLSQRLVQGMLLNRPLPERVMNQYQPSKYSCRRAAHVTREVFFAQSRPGTVQQLTCHQSCLCSHTVIFHKMKVQPKWQQGFPFVLSNSQGAASLKKKGNPPHPDRSWRCWRGLKRRSP